MNNWMKAQRPMLGSAWSRRLALSALALACALPVQAQMALGQTNNATPSSGNFRVAVPGNLFAKLGKGGPEGILLQAVDVLLRRMGKNPVYLSMPTSDALNDLKTGALHAATVVVPTASLGNSVWLSDPIVTESNIVVALKEKVFPLKKLADLEGKTIGGRTGYRYPLLEKDSRMKLERYASDGEMLRALLFGVTDVAIISAISDIYVLRSEGIMKRLGVMGPSVGSVPLVVAFSRKGMDEAELKRFNELWQEFSKSSEWKDIVERHGLADLMQEWPLIAK